MVMAVLACVDIYMCVYPKILYPKIIQINYHVVLWYFLVILFYKKELQLRASEHITIQGET